MKRLSTILSLLFFASVAFAQNPSIPIDFESTTITYTFNDFEGGVGSVIPNPDATGINTSANVGQYVKNEGAPFAGTTIPLETATDFGDNNAITMKVWSNRVGAAVLFKLEGAPAAERTVMTTVANQWEELTFDFTGSTGVAYTGITLILDNGTVGDGSADYTIYFDDIEYATISSEGGIQIPIDFESEEITYTFNDFEGGVGSVIPNPDATGINTSANVGQYVKNEGAPFAGTTIPLAGVTDFGDNNAITMKVWSNRVGAAVLLKLEGTPFAERTAMTTVANQWEELTFNFTGVTGVPYTGITLILDNGTVGDGSADYTIYFDDIEYATVSTEDGIQIPIDFESDELTYTFNDFEGGVGSVIPNPDATGINTSANVGQYVKNAGAPFAGTTIPLAIPPDFGDNNAIKMKVWSNRVGAAVLFKLEGAPAAERTVMTTVANQWEELTFNFTGSTGVAYTGITLILDNGTVGDGSADYTIYFDDIEYTTDAAVGVNLPIDFESDDLTYTFSDFEGGVGTVIANPQQTAANPSATVAQYVKNAGAVFAGTTLQLGSPINFEAYTEIEMKVFSNRVGASVMFKLEGMPAAVELFDTTTVANEWETLTYDVSELTGNTYTAITFILDLGAVGDGSADNTILIDDIRFPGSVNVTDLPSLDVTYYPNPVKDYLIIEAEEPVENVAIFNLNGQQVYFDQMDDQVREVDVSNLPAGTYFIRVSIGDREGVAKLIKQ